MSKPVFHMAPQSGWINGALHTPSPALMLRQVVSRACCVSPILHKHAGFVCRRSQWAAVLRGPVPPVSWAPPAFDLAVLHASMLGWRMRSHPVRRRLTSLPPPSSQQPLYLTAASTSMCPALTTGTGACAGATRCPKTWSAAAGEGGGAHMSMPRVGIAASWRLAMKSYVRSSGAAMHAQPLPRHAAAQHQLAPLTHCPAMRAACLSRDPLDQGGRPPCGSQLQ